MTKVAYVEWPDGLNPNEEEWKAIENQINNCNADILVTNEMPFGAWRPVKREYDPEQAKEWESEHEVALDVLSNLNVQAVLSSRPRVFNEKLVNEAFLLENGTYKKIHHKHYFPSEGGWHEASWFETEKEGFDLVTIGELKVGVLLCTELMFTEKARHYGKLGANLIISPRASGINLNYWEAACAMASVASGAYVISSNRVGKSLPHLPEFGGVGICYAPAGKRLGNTDTQNTIKTIDIDVTLSDEARGEYPCYLNY